AADGPELVVVVQHGPNRALILLLHQKFGVAVGTGPDSLPYTCRDSPLFDDFHDSSRALATSWLPVWVVPVGSTSFQSPSAIGFPSSLRKTSPRSSAGTRSKTILAIALRCSRSAGSNPHVRRPVQMPITSPS